MRRLPALSFALMAMSVCGVSGAAFSADLSGFSVKTVAGHALADRFAVQKFYTEKEGKFLWVDDDELNSEARDIVKAIGNSWEQGLNPENYHYNALQVLSKNGIPKDREIESEILFSDAVIRFGQDLSGMRLSPRMTGEDSSSWSRGIDGYSLLSILSEKSDKSDFLMQLAPQDDVYQALSGELKSIAKDLAENPEKNGKTIRFSGVLKPGMRHSSIMDIRRQLGNSDKSDIYDARLQKDVEEFQKLHGLAADGIIGPRSFDAINQTRTQKLVKLIANLERRRWIRRPMSPRHIEVNIPQMQLKAIENSNVVFEMPVIIGREKRPTVSFVDEIVGVRFNPSWYVPDTIKNEDYLPKLKNNPNALNDHGINFRVTSETGTRTVSSTDIDWKNMTPEGLKSIQMFQGPGEDNALGVIRVLMPNKYDIYLHDTNAPELFVKDDRALSSGCVRLSEPRKIANFILGPNNGWSDDRIDSYVAKNKLIEIRAEHPVPVYLFYHTVWVDSKDRIVIANDLYGLDTKLVQLLQNNGKIPFDLPKIR